MLVETGGNSNAYYFMIASGISLFEDNGIEIIPTFTKDEKAIDILTKWGNVISDTSITRNCNDLPPDASERWQFGRKLFAADHFLFTQTSARQFGYFNVYGMESEYGIVPNPKYTEEQERYYHTLDRLWPCMSIPATNAPEDLERISILMEDLSYQSSKTVVSAYYDVIIAIRRARVPELRKMVAIMKNSIYYDVSLLFTIDYATVLNEAANSGNIASTFQRYEKVLLNAIKRIQKKFGDG